MTCPGLPQGTVDSPAATQPYWGGEAARPQHKNSADVVAVRAVSSSDRRR
ncbi:MAG TPA: hypothetical protein PLF41_10475 [Anaerolineales bacterium]|jgi:hypothetical protein|nr:hypothetical protein [Anaerolineales bacterium]